LVFVAVIAIAAVVATILQIGLYRVAITCLAPLGEGVFMILHNDDLLPFQRNGDHYDKWLAVIVVGCLHLKKKKRNKTSLAVMNGSKATKELSSIIQSIDDMLVCMHKKVMV
jgi:hypothetical protein